MEFKKINDTCLSWFNLIHSAYFYYILFFILSLYLSFFLFFSPNFSSFLLPLTLHFDVWKVFLISKFNDFSLPFSHIPFFSLFLFFSRVEREKRTNLDGQRKRSREAKGWGWMKIETLEEMKEDSKKVLIIIFPRGGNGRLFSLREKERNREVKRKNERER